MKRIKELENYKLPKESGRRFHLRSHGLVLRPSSSTNTPNSEEIEIEITCIFLKNERHRDVGKMLRQGLLYFMFCNKRIHERLNVYDVFIKIQNWI